MRTRVRIAVRIASVAMAALVAISVAAPGAEAVGGGERSVAWRINHEHYRHRLRSLAISESLSNVARAHSYHMATAQTLYHSRDLASRVTGWRIVGENVAVGYNLYQIHLAWMRSAGHRDNILEGRYRSVGVGIWRDSGGAFWVTTIFKG